MAHALKHCAGRRFRKALARRLTSVLFLSCLATTVWAIETLPVTRHASYTGSVIASDPSVVFNGTVYRMAYTELDYRNDRTVIAMATSSDGRSWTPVSTGDAIAGVVVRGRNKYQDQNVEAPELVKTNSKWLLFFSGYRDEGTPEKGFPASLWMASSNDGVSFKRNRSAPVMVPTSGWYDNDAIHSPSIIRHNGKYIMAYAGHAYTDTSKIGAAGVYILGAESADGVTWRKLSKPLLTPGSGPAWMRDGAAEPELFLDSQGNLHMMITGLSGEDRIIGIARTSAWPGPFVVATAPVLAPDENSGETQVLAPSVVVRDGVVQVWYLSYVKKGSGLTWEIGQGDFNESLLPP